MSCIHIHIAQNNKHLHTHEEKCETSTEIPKDHTFFSMRSRDYEIFWIMSGSEIGVFRVYGGSSAAPSAALLASSAAVAAACINCKAQNDTQSPNMFHYALYNWSVHFLVLEITRCASQEWDSRHASSFRRSLIGRNRESKNIVTTTLINYLLQYETIVFGAPVWCSSGIYNCANFNYIR